MVILFESELGPGGRGQPTGFERALTTTARSGRLPPISRGAFGPLSPEEEDVLRELAGGGQDDDFMNELLELLLGLGAGGGGGRGGGLSLEEELALLEGEQKFELEQAELGRVSKLARLQEQLEEDERLAEEAFKLSRQESTIEAVGRDPTELALFELPPL